MGFTQNSYDKEELIGRLIGIAIGFMIRVALLTVGIYVVGHFVRKYW